MIDASVLFTMGLSSNFAPEDHGANVVLNLLRRMITLETQEQWIRDQVFDTVRGLPFKFESMLELLLGELRQQLFQVGRSHGRILALETWLKWRKPKTKVAYTNLILNLVEEFLQETVFEDILSRRYFVEYLIKRLHCAMDKRQWYTSTPRMYTNATEAVVFHKEVSPLKK